MHNRVKTINYVRTISFINYPERISSVIFFQGCNFNCFYCYNKKAIPCVEGSYTFDAVFDLLTKNAPEERKNVVFSGGEPTIQNKLVSYCERFKNEGFSIKIDTNGSNPEILKNLIENKLIDYIAMDIKCWLEKSRYEKITKTRIDINKIKESIELIKSSSINHEFRTVKIKSFHEEEEISKILEYVGTSKYLVNDYVTPEK